MKLDGAGPAPALGAREHPAPRCSRSLRSRTGFPCSRRDYSSRPRGAAQRGRAARGAPPRRAPAGRALRRPNWNLLAGPLPMMPVQSFWPNAAAGANAAAVAIDKLDHRILLRAFPPENWRWPATFRRRRTRRVETRSLGLRGLEMATTRRQRRGGRPAGPASSHDRAQPSRCTSMQTLLPLWKTAELHGPAPAARRAARLPWLSLFIMESWPEFSSKPNSMRSSEPTGLVGMCVSRFPAGDSRA